MKQKKLVIIGGGFTGSLVAKKLEGVFETTLIDKKDCFEFTPGILRAIVNPSHLRKLQIKHKDYLHKTKILKDEVKEVKNKFIKTKEKKIYYDYLVIASGSSYHSPIKAHNVLVASNSKILEDNYERLCKARKVLIVGGGVVGVELAAEISKRYKFEITSGKKEITLMHSRKRLMPREDKKICLYAQRFLEKSGINISFDKRCYLKDTKGCGLVLYATGIKPNSTFVSRRNLDERGYIKVNQNLQVIGSKNIFSGGDVISIKEEKLAQAAETHAHIIVHNILAQERKQKLKSYHPKIYPKVISLGKHKGIFTYKKIIILGFFPGLLKTLIEKYHMIKFGF